MNNTLVLMSVEVSQVVKPISFSILIEVESGGTQYDISASRTFIERLHVQKLLCAWVANTLITPGGTLNI